MLKKVVMLIVFFISFDTNAAIVKWELTNFGFDDGGTAHGSFLYDSVTNQLSGIDIYTTPGAKLGGRHYVAMAGAWGAHADIGVLAFTDTYTTNYTGAGWFRIDAQINFNAQPGTIVTQWLAVGAESFCVDPACMSAANAYTNPGQSRETISGHLVAVSNVPLPSAIWLLSSCLALLGFFGSNRRQQIN